MHLRRRDLTFYKQLLSSEGHLFGIPSPCRLAACTSQAYRKIAYSASPRQSLLRNLSPRNVTFGEILLASCSHPPSLPTRDRDIFSSSYPLIEEGKGDNREFFPKWNDPKRLYGGSHQDQADPIQLPLYSPLNKIAQPIVGFAICSPDMP